MDMKSHGRSRAAPSGDRACERRRLCGAAGPGPRAHAERAVPPGASALPHDRRAGDLTARTGAAQRRGDRLDHLRHRPAAGPAVPRGEPEARPISASATSSTAAPTAQSAALLRAARRLSGQGADRGLRRHRAGLGQGDDDRRQAHRHPGAPRHAWACSTTRRCSSSAASPRRRRRSRNWSSRRKR